MTKQELYERLYFTSLKDAAQSLDKSAVYLKRIAYDLQRLATRIRNQADTRKPEDTLSEACHVVGSIHSNLQTGMWVSYAANLSKERARMLQGDEAEA